MSENAGEFIVLSDASALAPALAEFVAARAAECISTRGRFDLALAGGTTPKAAYERLASPPLSATVDWRRVRFFFGDERCVPPADDASNYKMAAHAMLDPLGIAPDAVFRMRGEDQPAVAAAAYADVLRRELPAERGTPVFDLIMLGMGPDGHTASLFPGTDPYVDDASLVRAPFVEKFDTYRLTLTPCVLTAARGIVVAAAGESKSAALAAVRQSTVDPIRYPIAILRRAAGSLTWFVDRAAMSAGASISQ